MIVISDVNVLLYAVDGRSPFHKPCNDWLNFALKGPDVVGFTWHTICGFVRLATNPKVMGAALTAAEAFRYVKEWLHGPAILLSPGVQHLPQFESLVEKSAARRDLISDAHLAAIALECDGLIVSCDKDFLKFSGVRWMDPVTRQNG